MSTSFFFYRQVIWWRCISMWRSMCISLPFAPSLRSAGVNRIVASERASEREHEPANEWMYMYDCVWMCAIHGLFIGSFPFGWARGWREKIYCYGMIWKWILVGSDLYESKQISAWNILLISSYFWSEIERARNDSKSIGGIIFKLQSLCFFSFRSHSLHWGRFFIGVLSNAFFFLKKFIKEQWPIRAHLLIERKKNWHFFLSQNNLFLCVFVPFGIFPISMIFLNAYSLDSLVLFLFHANSMIRANKSEPDLAQRRRRRIKINVENKSSSK